MNNRVEVSTLKKEKRLNTFDEVEQTYTKKEAISESSRCLNCQNPRCVSACPVGINIPAFIRLIKEDNVDEAFKIISENNVLPGVCGRVCPQENQCEGACVRGLNGDAISIGSLEKYVADNVKNVSIKLEEKNNKKVLIVGSGPSGLSAAGCLAKLGYEVDIYEGLHEAGGVLTYGIPKFRLPEKIIKDEIKRLENMGVNIVLNALVGKFASIDELKNEYAAVYIATGAGLPKIPNICGINANQVLTANEVLTRINLMNANKDNSNTPIIKNKKVLVIGGGNVALDAARSLKRLKNEVEIIYRRSIEDMPARKKEINHTLEEDIKITENTKLVKINVDEYNNVISADLIMVDKNLKEIDNTNYTISCDAIVLAIGTDINHIVLNESNIKTNDQGLIIVDDNLKTNLDNVFAGGDIISGSSTVISACNHGVLAAKYIDKKLKMEDKNEE